MDQGVSEDAIASLLDQCASEYSWSTKEIISHTYHQLKGLSRQAVKRRAGNYKDQASIFRVAFHADKSAYSRFCDGLTSSDAKRTGRKTIVTQQDAPRGIRVKKE